MVPFASFCTRVVFRIALYGAAVVAVGPAIPVENPTPTLPLTAGVLVCAGNA